MPKGEFDTPGPFTMKRISRWTRYIYWRQHLALTVATGQDEAEGEEMLGLLNKGTHFDALVAHIKRERQGLANLLEFRWITDPGHRQAIHEAIMEADAVIASTEGRGDG